jgi:hypothetical protein
MMCPLMRSPGFGVFGMSSCLLLAGASGCTRQVAAVECTVVYGGEARRVQFPSTTEPYRVAPLDVAGRFRFKAIYVRDPWSAASISLYAYQQADAGDVLLHEAKYTPPFSPGKGRRYGFTGRQLVYSTEQRELEYWCELSP